MTRDADPEEVAAQWARLRERRPAMDAALAEALAALEQAGIGVLVLKGPVLEAWLYDRAERRLFGDLDLLVAPAELDRAALVLADLGYRLEVDSRRWPGVTAQHHLVLERADGSVVELHRGIPGIGVPEEDAWTVLWAGRTSVAGMPAPEPAFRALHLALHHAQHGASHRHSARPLERALAALPLERWSDAATLARRLEATPALAAGLAATRGGLGVLRALGLEDADRAPLLEAVGAELVWRSVRSGRDGLSLARAVLLPPRDYLAWRHPCLGPRRARLRHLLRVARRVPRALADLVRQRRR